jgi:plastocyanin
MRPALRAVTAVAVTGAVLGGVATAAPAAKAPKPKVVRIYDNYYGPAKVSVKAGTKVKFVWPADVGDTHDVAVRSAPKGVKKFQSPPYAAGAKWSRVFKKAGRYNLYCTFHSTEMTLTVNVKKR